MFNACALFCLCISNGLRALDLSIKGFNIVKKAVGFLSASVAAIAPNCLSRLVFEEVFRGAPKQHLALALAPLASKMHFGEQIVVSHCAFAHGQMGVGLGTLCASEVVKSQLAWDNDSGRADGAARNTVPQQVPWHPCG